MPCAHRFGAISVSNINWRIVLTLNKKQRERLLKENCGAINNDDAIDPRHYFYNKRKSKSKFRKIYQLCRQVQETLQLTLSDGHESLHDLTVVDVVPAPDSRRMLVVVELDRKTMPTATQIEELMACLANQVPRLRFEISQTINRRKTPQLIFELARLN